MLYKVVYVCKILRADIIANYVSEHLKELVFLCPGLLKTGQNNPPFHKKIILVSKQQGLLPLSIFSPQKQQTDI